MQNLSHEELTLVMNEEQNFLGWNKVLEQK